MTYKAKQTNSSKGGAFLIAVKLESLAKDQTVIDNEISGPNRSPIIFFGGVYGH